MQKLVSSLAVLFFFILDASFLAMGRSHERPTRSLVQVPKFHVEIHNDLRMFLLDTHCYSKNDDLGPQMLYPDDIQSWSFRESWFGTTKFHCRLEWERGYQEFEAFFSGEDLLTEFCPNLKCIWSAKQDGIYLNNRAGQSVFHFYWEMIREED